jgi:hypothetical protein
VVQHDTLRRQRLEQIDQRIANSQKTPDSACARPVVRPAG